MKICYVFLFFHLFVAISPSTSLGASTLHTFTTPDGRSLNAVIKNHNDHTGKIQIEREDGKKLWILPTVFSDPDQEYIQQWIAVDQFMSPTKFRIKGDSDKDRIAKYKTNIEYEITLENKTDFPLKDIKVEYRAFILGQGYEGRKDSIRVSGGQLHIVGISAGGKVSRKVETIGLVTKTITVTELNTYTGSSTTYKKKTSEERLKGFWVKVYGPAIDGTPAIREWCNPPDTIENFTWQAVTRNTAVQKGGRR